MRTRRSNRQKRYFTETFDLGEGSDDNESSALPRRARDVEEDDENFAAPDNDSAADQDDDEDEGEDEDADDDKLVVESDSDASVSGVEGVMRPASRIRDNKSIRASTARLAGVPQYLNITPFPSENQLPRGYAGYFDRNVRGRGLVRAWYGPDPKRMEIAARLLERWGPWKLLPPKEAVPNPDRPRKGVWSSDIFERETGFVERWLERLKHDRPPGTSFSHLSLDESHPYRLGPGTIPVLVGPSDSQTEIRLSSGGGVAITQHGLPFEQDEDPDKVPGGWMVDTGGIVLNMEWASQRRNQTQLVAMVVIPYGDQEIYSYGEQGIKPDCQRHGMIQLWEFSGQRTSQNTYIPDKESMPSLYKTICTDRGRVRSIRWNPACNHLAVLCHGGAICVVNIDDCVEGAPFGKTTKAINDHSLTFLD
jgi:transcription factor C subunit 6